MLRLLLAIPLALVGAVLGATIGVLLTLTSPRYWANLIIKDLPGLFSKSDGAQRGIGMIVIAQPASPAAVFIRVMVRAIAAFGVARLILLAFGLGPLRVVAVTIVVALTIWDFYWLASLFRMSFSATAATVRIQRTQLILGMIVSVVAAFSFLRT